MAHLLAIKHKGNLIKQHAKCVLAPLLILNVKGYSNIIYLSILDFDLFCVTCCHPGKRHCCEWVTSVLCMYKTVFFSSSHFSIFSLRIFPLTYWKSQLCPMTSCLQRRRGFVLGSTSVSPAWWASWSKQLPLSTWYDSYSPTTWGQTVATSTWLKECWAQCLKLAFCCAVTPGRHVRGHKWSIQDSAAHPWSQQGLQKAGNCPREAAGCLQQSLQPSELTWNHQQKLPSECLWENILHSGFHLMYLLFFSLFQSSGWEVTCSFVIKNITCEVKLFQKFIFFCSDNLLFLSYCWSSSLRWHVTGEWFSLWHFSSPSYTVSISFPPVLSLDIYFLFVLLK